MATPFSEVYDYFLSKVTDYEFIRLNNSGDLEEVLFKSLRSSTIKFTNCNKSLEFDKVNQVFNEDLDIFELEILATLMVVEYVSGKILDVKNMEQFLSDKDYQIRSQANHLKELKQLKQDMNLEASQLMSSYNLRDGLEDILE